VKISNKQVPTLKKKLFCHQNKLKCLFVASIYQSSLFAIKAACITLCVAPGLTHKYDTSLNQIVRAEHTSLLYLFIWDEVKGF